MLSKTAIKGIGLRIANLANFQAIAIRIETITITPKINKSIFTLFHK